MIEYSDRMSALRAKYFVVLRKRLNRLETALTERGETAPPDTVLEILRYDTHKTAGTAASFGFADLTQSASRVCRHIDELRTGEFSDTTRLQVLLEAYHRDLLGAVESEIGQS